MNVFKKFKAYLRFREAVKQADEAYQKYNHRFYVLPDHKGNLIIMDRRNFRIMRRKHYISRLASVPELSFRSVYHTPDAKGEGGVAVEEHKTKFKEYISYLRQIEKGEL